MDIILDTNIIISENFLRTKKFAVLIDYLKKTHSRIVLPQIVKEESISQYEKMVSSKLIEATKKIEDFSKICFTPVAIDFNIEVINETRNYIAYIQKLSKDGLLYEIPYDDKFLHEVVFRMINRKKPCSQKGEESRDAILWLSIKNLLKKEKSVAFVSNNSNEFASYDKKDLHPDLRAELAQEKLELKYYLTIDDFIKNHAEKVDYITKEWIEKELSKIIDLEDLITNHLADSAGLIHRIEWKTDNQCVSAYPIYISTELLDFYVYEMTNGDMYLNLVLDIVMEVEAELEKVGTKTLETDTLAELSAKIVNKEIKEIEIDEIFI